MSYRGYEIERVPGGFVWIDMLGRQRFDARCAFNPFSTPEDAMLAIDRHVAGR